MCFRNFVVAVRLFVTMEKALMNIVDIKNVPSLLLSESCMFFGRKLETFCIQTNPVKEIVFNPQLKSRASGKYRYLHFEQVLG